MWGALRKGPTGLEHLQQGFILKKVQEHEMELTRRKLQKFEKKKSLVDSSSQKRSLARVSGRSFQVASNVIVLVNLTEGTDTVWSQFWLIQDQG